MDNDFPIDYSDGNLFVRWKNGIWVFCPAWNCFLFPFATTKMWNVRCLYIIKTSVVFFLQKMAFTRFVAIQIETKTMSSEPNLSTIVD